MHFVSSSAGKTARHVEAVRAGEGAEASKDAVTEQCCFLTFPSSRLAPASRVESLMSNLRRLPIALFHATPRHATRENTMALLSDLYIAYPDQAARYDADPSLPDAERAQFNGLTCEEFSQLWAVLEPSPWTSRHAEEFECVLTVGGGERLVHRFPTGFVSALASLTEASAAAAAAQWAKVGELAYLGVSAQDVRPVIDAASRLSRVAQQSGKSLYLYMCT